MTTTTQQQTELVATLKAARAWAEATIAMIDAALKQAGSAEREPSPVNGTLASSRQRGSGWSDESRWRQGAYKLGIPYEEYVAHVQDGEKWCTGQHAWEPVSAFGASRRTRDGKALTCLEYGRLQAAYGRAAIRDQAEPEP